MARKGTSGGILQWVGIAALAYFGFTWLGGKISEKIILERTQVKNFKLTFSNASFSLILTFLNGSGISIPFDRFVGKLLYGNFVMADLDIDQPVVLAAGERVEVPVQVEVQLLNMATNILTMLQDGSWYQFFSVKGKVYSGGFAFPVKQNLQIL